MNRLLKNRNLDELIHEIAQTLDCDIQHLKQVKRLTGDDCDKREFMTLLVEIGVWSSQKDFVQKHI